MTKNPDSGLQLPHVAERDRRALLLRQARILKREAKAGGVDLPDVVLFLGVVLALRNFNIDPGSWATDLGAGISRLDFSAETRARRRTMRLVASIR